MWGPEIWTPLENLKRASFSSFQPFICCFNGPTEPVSTEWYEGFDWAPNYHEWVKSSLTYLNWASVTQCRSRWIDDGWCTVLVNKHILSIRTESCSSIEGNIMRFRTDGSAVLSSPMQRGTARYIGYVWGPLRSELRWFLDISSMNSVFNSRNRYLTIQALNCMDFLKVHSS